jgi:Phosphoribosylaminoimidazolesuccinocarboxamide (SAICAR) synthase
MTSVKDIEIHTPARPDRLGLGAFRFTDRYSIFDWGEMPDRLESKGAVLCTMGAYTFERLEAAGIPTHYRGVGDPAAPEPLAAVSSPPRRMVIELTQTPRLPRLDDGFDYPAYHAAGGTHHLVPLEIVFRNAIPPTSSVRRRLPPTVAGIDHAEWPAETVWLETPLIEFSTKFEPQDRYLDRAEAAAVAGPAEIDELESLARAVNAEVTATAAQAGFEHLDGKIECLYAGGQLRVADVAGTFDENRFRYDDLAVSKEVLRIFYRAHATEWFSAVTAAKRAAGSEWRTAVEETPPSLPPKLKTAVEQLYQSGADRYTGTVHFGAGDLSAAVARVDAFVDGQNT